MQALVISFGRHEGVVVEVLVDVEVVLVEVLVEVLVVLLVVVVVVCAWQLPLEQFPLQHWLFFVQVSCTGEPETFTVSVVGGKPFKKGTVLVNAAAQVCDTDSCTIIETPFEEFRLR